jgi:uncharacterized membrane protein
VSTSENGRFLDQFRYSIIASQLLTPEAKPTVQPKSSFLRTQTETNLYDSNTSFSLRGAAATAAISFFTASALHWMNLGIILVLVFVVAIVVCGYAIRKTSQRVRRVAVEALSGLIGQSHTFDTVARSGLNLVQEVEIVSRGYEM